VTAFVTLVVAAVALGLLAHDVLTWRNALRAGDREFARSPSAAEWRASTLLPTDPARKLLGLDGALRLRATEQSFDAVQAAGRGYDNGLSESQTRGELEAELARLGLSGDHVIASTADNLLGILAFSDAAGGSPAAPAPVDQAVADFQAAVRLDPSNADAKFNLERLLRELVAHGVRPGSDNGTGGRSRGHRGAGGGVPGRGY
jgi:hypothetical protein